MSKGGMMMMMMMNETDYDDNMLEHVHINDTDD